uniref:Uncharacterized protein n=1 Tax=Fagus sylvatica TaxID=28930 RepID=A0A2N9FUN9_FAGSY
MDAIVYIASARTMEQFWQQREELRTLVFQMEAFANVPFLILCIRNPGIDLSEEEMVNHLGLNNVQLANANVRPLEVFVVDKFNREHYLEGIKWLYDHLTNH